MVASSNLSLALWAFAGLLQPALARPRSCNAQRPVKQSAGKAIYMITNDPEQNAVLAVPISEDGTLADGGSLTATGGTGSISIDGASGEPAATDALVSQSALTIVGNNIFAVNAGSNTLSMLAIDPRNPTALRLVGRPVAIPAEFPTTVGASAKNSIVCVGSTGAIAGVSCSSFSARGLGPMDGLRPFDIGQTTPPVGPTNTVSHVFFSEDEATLFATVKGDPAVNNTGFLSAFSVQDCGNVGGGRGGGGKKPLMQVSADEQRSSPDGTAVLFGSAFIPGSGNSIFATDASFGGAILAVDPETDEASLAASQAIEGQAATCWVTISDVTNTAFVTDVAVNRVVEMSLDDASIVNQLDLSQTGAPGLIDLRASGNFIYALAPGNAEIPAGVTVLDVSGGPGSAKLVQHFDISGLGAKATTMGMAVLA